MTDEQVIDLAVRALWLTVNLSLPAIITAMVVGLAISVFQAATQIQEQTLTTVPKILAVVIVLAVTGLWAKDMLLDYARDLFQLIPGLGR
ncbi:MAG: flagellar biosynthesis protein FliQ [Planctomycetes bacterium]|nr:flagellar biosynthesis protein FliQ [Planctomycetota bacterium]